MTADGSGASERPGAAYLSTPGERPMLRAIVMAVRMEVRHMFNHFLRTSLAGNPLVPSALRWFLYRVTGLRISSPNVREECIMHNSYLEIRRGVFVNRACFFEGSGRIVIGEKCQVGPQCTFLTSHHEIRIVSDQLAISRPIGRDIVIGARVWVGGRTTFLPGCSVEDDVVIAAGAVVSGHLCRGWIYGGVPAKKISPLPVT